jgi:hypothetical protein
MHDAEAAERALRHEKEVCREAARKWANSLVHMRVKNWTVAEVDRKLKGKNLVTGADSQLRNLNEQLDALVDGYGYDDLKCPKSTSDLCCEGCGHTRMNHVAHLTVHVKWALGKAWGVWGSRGQNKPKEPPAPTLTVKKPPVLDESGDWRTAHPLDDKIRAVVERAKELVVKKVVEADVLMLADHALPKMDGTLVGKDIQYTFLVAFNESDKRRRKFTYYGTVLAVDQHAYNKGKKVTSAVVRWHEKGEPIEPVFLSELLHCELAEEHGWSVMHDGDKSDPREAADEQEKQYEEKKLQADFFLYKQ